MFLFGFICTCFVVWRRSPLLFVCLEEVHLSAPLRPFPNKWPLLFHLMPRLSCKYYHGWFSFVGELRTVSRLE